MNLKAPVRRAERGSNPSARAAAIDVARAPGPAQPRRTRLT